MTPDQFRKLALALPDAIEGAHGDHPDFRAGAGGKVFASLGAPDAAHGMVKLTPDQQALLIETNAKVFVPARGAWGEKGYTNVRLAAADVTSVKHALALAHANCTPKPKRAAKSSTVKGKQAAASAPAPAGDIDRTNARVRKAIKASKLPGIEEGTSYGYPSMKAGGKFMMRVKDADTLVFSCPLDEKAMLIEVAPEIYFETDHYKDWPAVLARLSALTEAELVHRIEQSWRAVAPKKLMAGLEARPTKSSSKTSKR